MGTYWREPITPSPRDSQTSLPYTPTVYNLLWELWHTTIDSTRDLKTKMGKTGCKTYKFIFTILTHFKFLINYSWTYCMYITIV